MFVGKYFGNPISFPFHVVQAVEVVIFWASAESFELPSLTENRFKFGGLPWDFMIMWLKTRF